MTCRRWRFLPKLRTVADFIDNVFYEVGYHFRAAIVGFNLPFDLSRLAVDHEAARAVTFSRKDDPDIKVTSRSMVGGFTFQLSQHKRSRIRIKHRSSRDAFYQFTSLIRGGRARRSFFIDVKTIAAALLDQARRDLQSANLRRLQIESGVSRQRLTDVRDGKVVPKRNTLKKIIAGLKRIAAGDEGNRRDVETLPEQARIVRDRIGLRKLARALGSDHSTVSQVLKGVRSLSPRLREKIDSFGSLSARNAARRQYRCQLLRKQPQTAS